MEFAIVNLDDLKEAEFNPRVISPETYNALLQSLREFGIVEPLVVNKNGFRIINGHQRLKALRDLGINQVPVVIVDLNKEDADLLGLALNNIEGLWHYNLLKEVLAEIASVDRSMLELTGLSKRFIDALLEESSSLDPEISMPTVTCPRCGTKFLPQGLTIKQAKDLLEK